MTRAERPVVAVYAAVHFLVDFGCAFLMMRLVAGHSDWQLAFLLYNFCAFALQMPAGLVADRLGRNAAVAAAGCALVASAFFLGAVPVAAAMAAGLGNCLFHVGGGVDVLNMSAEKSSALGIFVSPGAFGIYFGGILGRQHTLPNLVMCLALAGAAVLLLAARYRLWPGGYRPNAPLSLEGVKAPGALVALGLLFLVVCLRSYVGLAASLPWKSTWHWALILCCAVVLGKTAGGFLCDKLGAIRASVLSLGAAGVLFFFSRLPLPGVLGMLLFNMSMPITLWAVARVLPGAKGFSFGLLTFGLFVGYVPVYMGHTGLVAAPWALALVALASLGVLWAGLRRVRL